MIPSFDIGTPNSKNTCAIIVTYYPDASLNNRITDLKRQVAQIIIIDNGSPARHRKHLNDFAKDDHINLILNEENRGVASALNQGLLFAENSGYPWALLLDQDSICLPNLIKTFGDVYYSLPFREHIGILGTNYREINTGTTAFFKQNHKGQGDWVEVKEVITSGSLLSIRAFKETGLMRDDFFMYYVDHEYCARLRINGFKIVLMTAIGMMHSTGQCEIKHLFGQDFVVLHYPPIRLYYIVRNGLLLTRDFFFKDAWWAINRLWVVMKRTTTNILFEDDRLQRLKYAFLGALHAIFNRTGKLKGS